VALAIALLHFGGNLIAFMRPLTHGGRATETISRSEVVSAAWAAGFLIAIFVIGALPAVFLYFLLYFGLHGRRWLLGLVSALVMTAIAWGVFGQMIGINLPAGLFAGLLPQ
jgi:Tripartite tricarboxylate transporter TctB family